ncbi:MAG: hypothetical protein HUU50_20705 [Candidatus Brocadiae bacterium]|nr:hypothetical protein [Candidatus Brocadiia bacterium]
MLTDKTTNSSDPTVKDFLVYLVKKGILPKQAVSLCRKRKQEALEKGYSITVKDILLEQGYIADEKEYQSLWQSMVEDHKVLKKIQGKEDSAHQSFSLSENLLQELLSDEEFQRDKHPDVPTDVILTVFNRWKDKNSENKKKKDPKRANSLQRLTQRIQESAIYSYHFWKDPQKILACLCLLSFSIMAVLMYQWGFSSQQYAIQRIQYNIPGNSLDKESILEGKIEKVTKKEMLSFSLSKKQ